MTPRLLVTIWIGIMVFSVKAQSPNTNPSAQTGLAIKTSTAEIAPPTGIEASDGKYERYIRVKWDKGPIGTQYKLFKATSELPELMRPVKDRWTTHSFLVDVSQLAPGVEYHYRVKARLRGEESDFSLSDTGFIPARRPVASPRDTSSPLSPLPDSLQKKKNE